jgi:predicted ATPase
VPPAVAPAAPTALPAGTVTFVVTDIEQSTRLLRTLGDRYAGVLDRHRALLRDAWARWGGHEVDCLGDSSLVAFSDAAAALQACVQAQRALRDEAWPERGRVRVRMGVHAGLAAPSGDRYVALAVHQAARVGDVGHGDQVVVSEVVAGELARCGAGPGIRSLGRYRLRDFERPVELHQVLADGLPRSFPPVRAMPADRHNLTPPATSLVGREADLAALEGALSRHRMVTVVGPGGVGKTRLVTELGVRAAPTWPGGVWLVDCAALDGALLARRALVDALGAGIGADDGGWEGLLDRLRSAEVLVVLDGCEPHATVTAQVARQLLAACPPVRVLATSTEPLRVPGEVLHRVAPLSVSGAGSPAVRLFLERAAAVVPAFRADRDTGAVVESICRRLDGLPLALEIAAAKLTALQPAEILAGLERRFELLRERGEARPSRHRTLRGLLDWSCRLLPADEAATLRRLSLFSGSFDVAGATAVAAAGDVERESVPVVLWSLVDRSLVMADPAAGGTRYRLLETVRAYSAGRLGELERRAALQRLVEHYAERLGPARGTGGSWVHDVAADLATVRQILSAAPAPGDASVQALASALARYHDAVQTYREGVAEVTALAARLTAATPARVGLLSALGDLHLRVGDADAAEESRAAAAGLRERVGAPDWDEVGVEKLAGEIALHRGEPAAAAAIATRALASPLSPRGRARMHNLLGIALATLGDDPAAAAAFTGELWAAEELDDEVLLAHAHSNLAEIALRQGRPAVAARHQRTCLDLALALGRTGMIAYGLIASARIAAVAEGAGVEQWATGVRLVTRAVALLADTGAALHETDRRVMQTWQAEARDRLGPERFLAEEAAGRAATVESVLAAAGTILVVATAARSRAAG